MGWFSHSESVPSTPQSAPAESDDLWRVIVDSVADGIMLIDQGGVIRAVNRSIVNLLGYSRQQLVGRDVSCLLPCLGPGRCAGMISLQQETGEPGDARGRRRAVAARCRDGSWRQLDLRLSGVDSGGERLFVAVLGEVSERGFRQAAYCEDHEFVSTVIENTNAVVVVLDAMGRVVRLNRASLSLMDRSREETEGKFVWDLLFSAEEIALVKDFFTAPDFKVDSEEYESRWRTRNGSPLVLVCKNSVVTNPDGSIKYIIITGVDITHRRQAEQEREQILLAMGERVKELSCMYAVSESIRKRKNLEEIFSDAVTLIPPGWQYPEITRARILFQGQEYCQEDFEETDWLLSSPIMLAGNPCGAVEVYYSELRPEFDEGPFLSEERQLIEGLSRLLSEAIEHRRMQEALQQSEVQLQETRKLEVIGQLASGIAHDFNNLITVILASTSALESQIAAGRETREELDLIRHAAEQARGVTGSLLTFSRGQPIERVPIRLQSIVIAASGLLRRILPASIELETKIEADDDCWVNGDSTQLQQVLLNLAINARDAMPKGGSLCIALHSICDESPGRPAGSAACVARISVGDTGTGISPELRSRIFEPFFSSKPRGEGVGLGLSLARGIIHEHGGQIDVESEPECGTTVTLELPCIDPPRTAELEWCDEVELQGEGGLILLAEDHPQVRAVLAAALKSLGYEVAQVGDGPSLLELFDEQRDRVRLLVVDIDLPGKSGAECLLQLRADGVETPALAISGNVETSTMQLAGTADKLLRKPFELSELAKAVTELLDGATRVETSSS